MVGGVGDSIQRRALHAGETDIRVGRNAQEKLYEGETGVYRGFAAIWRTRRRRRQPVPVQPRWHVRFYASRVTPRQLPWRTAGSVEAVYRPRKLVLQTAKARVARLVCPPAWVKRRNTVAAMPCWLARVVLCNKGVKCFEVSAQARTAATKRKCVTPAMSHVVVTPCPRQQIKRIRRENSRREQVKMPAEFEKGERGRRERLTSTG